MTKETNRREFVQVAGLATSGLMATAGSLAAAEARPVARTMGARFRELMNGPEPLICANAYDVLTARLIEVHGFKGVFVGSGATNLEPKTQCREPRTAEDTSAFGHSYAVLTAEAMPVAELADHRSRSQSETAADVRCVCRRNYQRTRTCLHEAPTKRHRPPHQR